MNKSAIRNIVTSTTTGVATLSLFAQKAFAENLDVCANIQGSFKAICKLGNGGTASFSSFIGSVINLVFIVAIVAALFYLIYGGIKWLISEGDKTAVDEARKHIIASIIGLIIVFLSYFILNFVLFFFTGSGLSNITLPTLPN